MNGKVYVGSISITLLERIQKLVRSPQMARHVRADLHVDAGRFFEMEVRIETGNSENALHVNATTLRHLLHLLLRQITVDLLNMFQLAKYAFGLALCRLCRRSGCA